MTTRSVEVLSAITTTLSANQVGRSYGRVIVYCSNFERTAADALFFESLLCLARMVVAAAVAEPSLAPEVRVSLREKEAGARAHAIKQVGLIPCARKSHDPRHI